MFTRRRVFALVSVLLLALLLAACGGGGGGNDTQNSSSGTSQSSSSSSSSVRELEVVLSDFSFSPQEFRVKSGEKVRLVLKNEGTVAHDWHVEALNLSTPLVQPGQTATFEFTVGEAGSYQTICTEPGHEALGMVGTLIIE